MSEAKGQGEPEVLLERICPNCDARLPIGPGGWCPSDRFVRLLPRDRAPGS